MLDICSVYVCGLHITLYSMLLKLYIMSVGYNLVQKPTLFIANQPIAWVDSCKYLIGMTFIACSNLVVDVKPKKRKFYAALNSLFFPEVQLLLSQLRYNYSECTFCLPLFVYYLGALELSACI